MNEASINVFRAMKKLLLLLFYLIEFLEFLIRHCAVSRIQETNFHESQSKNILVKTFTINPKFLLPECTV